jgi:hypothetical protein
VATGNIAVYRVVLAEQLLGVVLEPGLGHGATAVITTVIIVLALIQVSCENLVLFGSGRLDHPRAFAARGLLSLSFIAIILMAKLAMGIVYYSPLPLCPVSRNHTGLLYVG